MFNRCRPCATAVSLVLLGLGLAFAAPPGQHHSASKHPKKKQLGKALARVKNGKTAARSELRRTKAKAHSVKLDIMSVDNKLVAVKDDLEDTRSRLAKAKVDRARAADALKKSTAQLTRTRQLVTLRIKHIYMQGPESGFSAFSGTQSGGDIASHRSLMDAIEKKDRTIFNAYIALQKRVEAEKRQKDEAVREVARLENRQEAQTHVLAETREEKASFLGDLKQKESDLESSIQQFQVDESRITSEIAAYERAAREAEREEREARRHANAGGVGGRTHHGGGGGRTSYVPLGAFSGRFSRPVNAPITSTFGSRFHPILHRVRMHTGVDFGASYGTPIHAAAEGIVISSGYMGGYGHVVVLAHGGGYSTVYAHTSHVYCSNGQHVSRGQVIAAVGASGLATGPHLHFEVRVNGHPVNPLGHF